MCCSEPRDKNAQHAKNHVSKVIASVVSSGCAIPIDTILQESSNSKKKITANGVSEMLQDVNTLKTQNEELAKDNKKYQKINKELRAKKNDIKAVTASDKLDKTPGENKSRVEQRGKKLPKLRAP